MRRLLAAVLLACALAGTKVDAQTIAASPRPDHVAVTVYRDPNRTPEVRPNLGWLNGYALISETRQVTLPAGEAELRFEGVAGGIVPQSAIVTGLPEGVIRGVMADEVAALRPWALGPEVAGFATVNYAALGDA